MIGTTSLVLFGQAVPEAGIDVFDETAFCTSYSIDTHSPYKEIRVQARKHFQPNVSYKKDNRQRKQLG